MALGSLVCGKGGVAVYRHDGRSGVSFDKFSPGFGDRPVAVRRQSQSRLHSSVRTL
jgi:hypothetical protein